MHCVVLLTGIYRVQNMSYGYKYAKQQIDTCLQNLYNTLTASNGDTGKIISNIEYTTDDV